MAMGYTEHRCIITANQGHLQCGAVLSILINLAVLRRQSPRFIQIYSQALQWDPNLLVNNWGQACRIVSHPAYPHNDLGLMFEPPSSSSSPWIIQTVWHEDQVNTLVLKLRPSIDALQNLLVFANAYIRTHPASNPFEGTQLEGQTPLTIYSAPFITANPVKGAFAPPPTPSVVWSCEQSTPASTEDSAALTSTVCTPRHKSPKPPPSPSKS